MTEHKTYGPRLGLSEEIHSGKYRLPNENFERAMTRISATLKDGDEHFEKLRDILLNQRFLPAGRVQSAIGSPRDVTAYNCLGGETKVITKEYGLIPIENIVGKTVSLIDGNGNWTKSEIRSFGQQQLYNIIFTKGRKKLYIRATADHDWVSKGLKVKTSNLKNVDINLPKKVQADPLGVVHGLIYGGGTETKNGFNYRVCGDLKDLLPYLKDFPFSKPPSCNGDSVYYFYGENIWADFKELPTTLSTDEYLLGFIQGWLAADGCVSTQPEITICGNESEKNWLSIIGPRVGFYITGSSKLSEKTNFGVRKKQSKNIRFDLSTFDIDNILINRKKERLLKYKPKSTTWRVDSIDEGAVEEVYCAIVPTTKSFSLVGFLHSGNCFVSGTILDSMSSIMQKASEAAETMRRGGGIGYDFSRLRPRGDIIGTLDSRSSGPISFMNIYDAICQTISSAGHRRGAQMGVLRVDHPDIEEFIRAKSVPGRLTGFNVSVGVTDLFMECVKSGEKFPLVFEGKIYKYINAGQLWEEIMRSTWDWAEPGVLFIDRINQMNNLYYCESIEATNPCKYCTLNK